ncbi:MAG: hypothetical protein ACO1PI_15010 [Bacteroidota bacterium]
MKELIELKLTRQEYEKLLIYNAVGNHISHAVNSKISTADIELLKKLLFTAKEKGLVDFITDVDGHIALNKKLVTKMIKLLEGYENVLAEEMAEHLLLSLAAEETTPKQGKKK